MTKILLTLAGAVVGLVLWALAGLGMTELGLLSGFDPFDHAVPPPPISTATTIAEWSFPVFAIVGAFLLPRVAMWMLRSPSEIRVER
jgi:hypothetical protein